MKLFNKMGKKCKETFLQRKLIRAWILFFLAGMVCLLDNKLCYPPQIPDIVFVCTKYDEVKKEICEIIFIDQYGTCYYSDDPYVCSRDHKELMNAYKTKKIEDKIKLRGSCSRKELIRKYRKIYRIFKKKKISTASNGGLWPCVLTVQWDWHWLYLDASGEVNCSVLHTKKFGDAYYSTNNKQVNQIYEWCEDIMGEME